MSVAHASPVEVSEARPRLRAAISLEALAYVALFMAAVGLRWIRLGVPPLSEAEARQAMAAWHLISPRAPGAGLIESPLVFAGAAIGFFVAGASNAAARFLPMLGGVALVFTPLAFRRRMGRFPALLATAWLALSPVAVATSRQVGGIGLSMLGLVLALAALDRVLRTHRRGAALFAGVALGVALLSDYGTLAGLLAMGIGFGFARATDEEELLTPEAIRDALSGFPWGALVGGLLGTLAILGTLFFLVPDGPGAAADQLGRFVAGLTHRSAGATYAGLTLVLYEPVLLILGLTGAWLASQSGLPWQRFLAGWGVAALLLTLVYPGALPGHSLWSVVPLVGLAGLVIGDLLEVKTGGPVWGAWVHAAGTIGLLGMVFASLSRHLRAPRTLPIPPGAPPQAVLFELPLDLTLTVLWIILLVVLWLTVASLWGPRAAWRGTGLSLALLAPLIALGGSVSLAFTRPTSPYEPLNVSPPQPMLDLLVQTAEEIGNFSVGHPHEASITVQADPNGALAWALRDFNAVTFVLRADPTVESAMVITPAGGADPALGSGYVGQDFVIERTWRPVGLNASQFLSWALYRRANTPPVETRVILWVREDVYRMAQTEGTEP